MVVIKQNNNVKNVRKQMLKCVRTASLNETSSFVEIIGSGKTYTKAYNEGWYGVSSNNFVLYKQMIKNMN